MPLDSMHSAFDYGSGKKQWVSHFHVILVRGVYPRYRKCGMNADWSAQELGEMYKTRWGTSNSGRAEQQTRNLLPAIEIQWMDMDEWCSICFMMFYV